MVAGEPQGTGRDVSEALSAPTRRLLFRRVGASDAPSAVVRRLRAAIVLGLLPDGDKLPREADLAKELGVTSFSLREALSVLRSDGLIITRPGRSGGSFVRRPQEPLPLANDELVRLSSPELRDLGDWRQMLTSAAAGLAAQRAAQSNVERLSLYADQVATADDSEEARRAYARYHVELAAAAQSPRLSRAEFSMHEEFDWLVGLILSDPLRRRDSARALRAVTAAIRDQQPQAAHLAAERHVTAVIKELARLRLDLKAAQHRTERMPAGPVGKQAFGLEIRRFAEHIVQQLNVLAAAAAEPLAAGDAPTVIQQRVAASLFSRLGEIEPATHGLGVIAEVGAVPGHAYWLDWWQRTKAGGLDRDTRHVMDPRRDDFYDYESREFIAHPRKDLVPWATGPYVDHGGVDDYLVTVSVPIVREGRFLGVAATDLLAADLEGTFAPWLARAENPCLLLNAEGRVIVSNSVTHHAGDVARVSAEFHAVELGVFGWSLATETVSAGQSLTAAAPP
jgi:DNA-binding FadR family transcriptional regulator